MLVFSQLAVAQVAPAVNWKKTLGGSNNDQARGMVAAPDGGYVIVGGTESNDGDVTGNHGNADFWVVKLDVNGNRVWQKTFGGSKNDIAYAVTTTLDGGYVVAGRTESNDGDVTGNHGGADFWVVKLDGNGNMIWQKALGGSRDDYANAVIATSDGDYVLAGTAGSNNGDVTVNRGFTDYWVVRLDGNGNKLWQKTFGGSHDDFATTITASADGGYLVGGQVYFNDGDITGFHKDPTDSWYYADYWLVKLDESGNLIWQKALGGKDADLVSQVIATTDGGYVLAGQTYSRDGDVSEENNHASFSFPDAWAVKLNSAGSIIWQKVLGGLYSDHLSAVTITAYGEYVFAGAISSDPLAGTINGFDAWAVKLDGAGNLIWQKSLGGSKGDQASAVLVTANGNCVLAGVTASTDGDVIGNHGLNDFWVVKLDSAPPAPCVSVQSGDWSNPATWLCGREPTVQDVVTISQGHVVTISTNSAQAKQIKQNGTLRYVSRGAKILVTGN
ncbi:hypothetical protein GCM10027341_17690 [Spirosoma knui]